MILGGVEAGGTKWVCGKGSKPSEIDDVIVIPTGAPAETLAQAIEYFAAEPVPSAIGIGSFGPVDLRTESPTWGHITTTPKDGWRDTSVAAIVAECLSVPIGFDTDVNAAALGELCAGAATGLDTFCYVTIGTGIGGGGVIAGRPIHGLLHPEFGHMRIPHDYKRDPFVGSCPYHGDCWEGLASGTAVGLRWGYCAGSEWADEHLELEAEYIALGLINVICVLSPQRVIVGGGVMSEPKLLPRVRTKVSELAADYFDVAEFTKLMDDFIVQPALDGRAGLVGALELARIALDDSVRSP